MIGKSLRKIILAIARNIFYIKEKEICPEISQKLIRILNNSISDSKRRKEGWLYLSVKSYVHY